MRNLKRVLSLALASAMLLGMMVMGAGAADVKKKASDLTDMDKVTNKAAVSLLVDLGVIEGKTDGSYAPAEIVNRATMAKLIYVIRMGNTDASAFVGVGTPLTDVKGHWAEGFINYCYSNGLVAGTGANTFAPDGNLTTAAAAKMLLVALGYDADAQGYQNDPQWTVNITRDAQRTGLLEKITENASAQLSRDSAAQMIFNTLFAKTVTNVYGRDLNGNKYVTSTTQNPTTLGQETYKLAKVEGVVTGITATGKAIIDGVVSELGANKDVIGAKAVYYKNSTTGKLISSSLSVGGSAILGTSTSGALVSTLKNPDSSSYLAAADTTVTYYIDGVKNTVDTDAKGLTVTNGVVGGAANGIPDSIDDITVKRGTVVELIDNDANGKYDVVRVTVKNVAKIGDDAVTIIKATSATKKDAIKIDGITAINGSIAAEDVIGYADLAANDIVLWVKIGNKFYIEKTESVSGTVTGRKTVNGVSNYVMDGSNYAVSGLGTAPVDVVAAIEYNKDMSFHLDNNGSIVFAKLNEAAAAANYAVVTDIVFIANQSAGTSGGYTEAQLLHTDGTLEVVKVSSINGMGLQAAGAPAAATNAKKSTDWMTKNTATWGVSSETTAAGTAYAAADETGKFVAVQTTTAGTAMEGLFFSYKAGADGKYSLTSVKSDVLANKSVSFTSGTVITNNPVIDADTDVTTNNATIFLNKIVKGTTVSYKVYTGISTVPTTTSGTAAGHAILNKSNTLASFVYLSAGTPSTAGADEIAYVTGATYVDYVPETGANVGDDYYNFNAIVKGELTTIKLAPEAAAAGTIANDTGKLPKFTTTGFMTLNKDSNGIVTAAAATAADNATANNLNNESNKYTGTVKAADGVIGVDSNATTKYLSYSDDAVVYYIDQTTRAVTTGTISGLATDDNDTVVVTVLDANGLLGNLYKKSIVTALYVTVVPATGGAGTPGEDVTGFTVTAPTFTAGASKVTFGATVTAKDITATGPVTTSIAVSMLANGTWIPMAPVTDSDTMTANTPVVISTDVTGVKGTTYKFDVTITFAGESTVISNAGIMIVAE